MAVSKSQQKAVNKYMAANYDRVNLTLPKGQKDVIKDYAATRGESVNGFIGRAISETIERDGGGIVAGTPAAAVPQESAGGPQGSGGISLPPDVLEAVQQAAEAAGETVPDYIARAAVAQVRRERGGPSTMILLPPTVAQDAFVGGFAVGQSAREFVIRAVRELVERERRYWDDETLRLEELNKSGLACLPFGALDGILGKMDDEE